MGRSRSWERREELGEHRTAAAEAGRTDRRAARAQAAAGRSRDRRRAGRGTTSRTLALEVVEGQTPAGWAGRDAVAVRSLAAEGRTGSVLVAGERSAARRGLGRHTDCSLSAQRVRRRERRRRWSACSDRAAMGQCRARRGAERRMSVSADTGRAGGDRARPSRAPALASRHWPTVAPGRGQRTSGGGPPAAGAPRPDSSSYRAPARAGSQTRPRLVPAAARAPRARRRTRGPW